MTAAHTAPPTAIPPRKIAGRIEALLTTAAKGRLGFVSAPVSELVLDHEGIVGNRHRGWIRQADARVPYLPRGTPIRNERHLSIASREELVEMARRLELPALDPAWIGANVVMSGIPHLSFLPRGTRLMLPGKAILIVTDQNAPCTLAGAAIAQQVPGREDIQSQFPKVAQGLRGVVATVEHPGVLTTGTSVDVRMPAQWIYA